MPSKHVLLACHTVGLPSFFVTLATKGWVVTTSGVKFDLKFDFPVPNFVYVENF